MVCGAQTKPSKLIEFIRKLKKTVSEGERDAEKTAQSSPL